MSERSKPETDVAEAKRRAEWLHKHKAHKDWIILSVSEVAVIRDELLILERERDQWKEISRTIGWMGELERVYKERDELRAARNECERQYQEKVAEIAQLLSERDEAREEWGKASMDAAQLLSEKTKVMKERDEALSRAKELAELVDASYILVELHKPDCEYNKKWRVAWMEKAKRLIPGVDSIWY